MIPIQKTFFPTRLETKNYSKHHRVLKKKTDIWVINDPYDVTIYMKKCDGVYKINWEQIVKDYDGIVISKRCFQILQYHDRMRFSQSYMVIKEFMYSFTSGV